MRSARADAPPHYALLIVDLVNAFDFDGGEALLEQTRPIVQPIARLKRRARLQGVPVIYANDNLGLWRSNFPQVVAACIDREPRSAPFIQAIHPQPDDYFVLKPMQSAFQSTPLERLLACLGVRGVILSGIAADGCVLATAIDAHTRGYGVVAPHDCTASETPRRKRNALELMSTTFGVDTRLSSRVTSRSHLR